MKNDAISSERDRSGETDLFEVLKESCPTLSVGLMAADFMNLESELREIDSSGVKLLHFDVMDGRFCPAMTAGPFLVQAIRTKLFKDVHLMIEDPLSKLEDYVAAGADMITVHLEADFRHIHKCLQVLGAMKNGNGEKKAVLRGIALNPGTRVEAVEPLLEQVEIVTILAINPGWGGQKFLPATGDRLETARRMIESSGRDILLCVDGGVKRDNIADVARMGPDIVVTGSAVFSGESVKDNVRFMLDALG